MASHPNLSRIEEVLNRNNPGSPTRNSSEGASGSSLRRQSLGALQSTRPTPLARAIPSLSTPGSPMSPRAAPRSASGSYFVPRLVRGTIEREPPPAQRPSVSPTRARRSSSTLPLVTRSAGTQPRPASSSSSSAIAAAESRTSSFPKPAYIEQSALRHFIHSEPLPVTLPNRQRLDALDPAAPAVPSSRSAAAPTATTVGSSSSLLGWNRSRERSPSAMTETDDETSTTGMRDPPAPHSPANRLPSEQILNLPTRWSDVDRFPSLSVSQDGRDLTFLGPSGADDSAGAARANHPVPAACGVYYYEVEILNRGVKGHISVGFSAKSVKLTRLPGWEGHSWGYHGDDGRTFADQRHGTPYGPTFSTNDVIGCGIDFSQGRAFFTKNGRFLGLIFDGIDPVGKELYPSVGLRSPEESIRANFGQDPFQFDIASHVQQQRTHTWNRIQQTQVTWRVDEASNVTLEAVMPTIALPLAPAAATSTTANENAPHSGGVATQQADGSHNISAPINELVLAYLTHHGYAATAHAFKTQCDERATAVPATSSTDADVQMTNGDDNQAPQFSRAALELNTLDTQARQRIVNAVLVGDIDAALSETEAHYPDVLSADDACMRFKMRCRKLSEMILAASGLSTANASGPGRDDMDVDGDMDGLLNGHADDDASPSKLKTKAAAPALAGDDLRRALDYGREVLAEYACDMRPEVQAVLRRTSVLWAFANPREEGGDVTEYAGQAARIELANELNQAILESQGRPSQPALERLYRHTAACVMALGWIGIGAAAFADMQKEFLD